MRSFKITAFAAALIPLFRRKPGPRDSDEFGGDPVVAPPAAEEEVAAPRTPRGPERVAPTVNAADAAPASDVSAVPAAGDGDELELEVQRYRAALRAGTLCSKCGQANPADSRFCFDCGAALPLQEAREFD